MEKIILDAIIKEFVRQRGYVCGVAWDPPEETPEDVVIDGHYDLVKLARVIAEAIKEGGQMVEKVR